MTSEHREIPLSVTNFSGIFQKEKILSLNFIYPLTGYVFNAFNKCPFRKRIYDQNNMFSSY